MPVPIVVDSVSQSTASPTATPQPTATAALPPAIFISEFLADPQAVGDDLGEWIELYNAGDTIINLRNWQLLDLDNDQHVIAIDLVIAPGQYLVLARNTDTAINGGVAAAYQYNNLALANSNDELLLVTPDGAEADRVRWGEGTALTTKAGASLQRLLQDNNQVWIESSAVWSGSSGDTGTPGQPYTPEIATPMQPTPTAITPNTTPIPATATPPSATWPQAATGSPLIIDELLYSGSDAEFVVLVNASTATVDLTGWTIGDEETPGAGEGFYTLPPGAQLSAGALLVIARDGAVFRATWGRSADAEFADTDATTPDLHRRRDLGGGQWALNDSGDEVILLNPSGEVADAVVFGDGDYGSLGATGALRAAKGFALQRVPGATYLDGSDQRHRFLYGPPQPFTSIQLPATTAPSALPVQSGWRIVWGSLGAQSNFSDGGTAPPHYLQAAAAAQGLNFLAIADPTLITPWQSASPLTALPAWQWQGEGGAAIVYNQQTQPAGDLETLLTQAEIGDTQIQWQDGTLPATGPLSALAADQISVPESLSTLYKQWRSAGTPLLPSGNANPPVPGALAPAPRYTGLVIEQSIADTDAAAALKRALAARRGWLTNTPGLWLTLAQQQNDGSLHWMGGTLAAQNEITLQISYGDRSGDLAGLAIWQDDRPLRQIDLPTANRTWEVTLPALPNTLLYAVATQADGGFAVTAPLYILPAQGGALC
ncbi:MAG: lamin tail domain-containing protein [Caldilineaceae bacterium]